LQRSAWPEALSSGQLVRFKQIKNESAKRGCPIFVRVKRGEESEGEDTSLPPFVWVIPSCKI